MVPSALPEPPAAPALSSRQKVAWESFFARLLEFKRQHGHFHVPDDAEHVALFYWTAHQRSHLKTGRLRADRRERLLAADFPGEPRALQRQAADRIWDRHFAELLAFYQHHGHFKIPCKDPHYKLLKEWVNHMRRKKASGTLKPDRAQRLEAAGFPWSGGSRRAAPAPRDAATRLKEMAEVRWENKFAELRAFHLAHGHFNVPEGLFRFRGLSLGSWVLRQRRHRKLGWLSRAQEQRLTALGFPWETEWPPAAVPVDPAKKSLAAETAAAGPEPL